MSTRTIAPIGSPCWADLWTSDVEGSRRFYCELFGWDAQAPSPEFGGYFMFTRDGVPVAGGMGDMPDVPAQNFWKIYLTTDDIAKTVAAAETEGAQVIAGTMPVADLGTQAVLLDPTGAHLGAWQPGTFPGFTVLDEPGTPSWFELHTRDHASAVAFYRSVFRWETEDLPGDHGLSYTTMRDPGGEGQLAGIMDASAFLPADAPSAWTVYWEVEDVEDALSTVRRLGGSVVDEAQDSPYGRIATAADPAGATFWLCTGPR